MPPILLYTLEQLRRIEREHASRFPDISLMQRAGEAAAKHAIDLLDGKGGRVLVLAGPGNNGGDAWVAARTLQTAWHRVTVLETAATDKTPAAECRAAREAFLADGGKRVQQWPDHENHDLILDGLLGIGIARPATGDMAALIQRANDSAKPILALDVPSGLAAETGVALGPAVRATRTLTFIGAKPGLYTADGADYCGEIHIAALGIEPSLLHSEHHLLALCDMQGTLPQRRHNSHKGQYGAVGVIGGANGMLGAAMLAARAALHLGAGKVFLAALADNAPAYDSLHPEIMMRSPREIIAMDGLNVLVIGPGMGTGDGAKNLVAAALKSALPLIIDADALNLIAGGRALQNQLARRTQPALLTPHPGEAARLLHCSTQEVHADRIKAACALAVQFRSPVLLKGAGSIVAPAQGGWHINASGNPGMASGGMGDVLSGMLGALLAQGMTPESALKLGACLHGAAADQCVSRGMGPAGLTASELLPAARELFNACAA